MDAAEVDQDVLLQRSSAELLADFQGSLKPFLWRRTESGKTQIRRRVRLKETERLVNLLEPFQELPQLLDPHLDKLVPTLANAFLAHLQSPLRKESNVNTRLLLPLSRAICRLLYTFCKIRGEKVIVRFLSTETRHLELLLSAIERGSPQNNDETSSSFNANSWDWEERYVTLLWLSQLLLAPFDLASISSQGTEDVVQLNIPGFICPKRVPGVTLRAISLAVRYLSSSGKERDAAKALLVRVAMRKDMQQLGVLGALVEWAVSCIHSASRLDISSYYYIGILSFIAGILVSSTSTADMDSYLYSIYQVTQDISVGENPVFQVIKSSAVARKIIIKILRTIVLLVLPKPQNMTTSSMIETTIGHNLESLSDSATPVRLAASKALSIITLKLDPDMASQVVEEVLATLQKDVLWVTIENDSKETRDLARVNSLEWHGLILTLSHLLYRRSISSDQLSPILDALRLGLSFEQRSTSGSSVGTNVRDAACFGIWAMARRYKTAELQSLKVAYDVFTRGGARESEDVPALQTLATDLVVSASLDPAGNIRRGSSAALQELVGRHPDIIAEGIPLVQVVDYHAVALRSRAVQEVAIQAAGLSDNYHNGILNALLGWRGVKGADPPMRRIAASAVGQLVWSKRLRSDDPWYELQEIIELIGKRIQELQLRESDERHGLILCLASIVGQFSKDCNRGILIAELKSISQITEQQLRANGFDAEFLRRLGINKAESAFYSVIYTIKEQLFKVLETVNKSFTLMRNNESVAEAVSRLMVASNPILRVDCAFRQLDSYRRTITNITSSPSLAVHDEVYFRHLNHDMTKTQLPFIDLGNPSFSTGSEHFDVAAAKDAIEQNDKLRSLPSPAIVSEEKELVQKFLELNGNESTNVISDAAADLTLLLSSFERNALIEKWEKSLKALSQTRRRGQGDSYLYVLFKVFPIADFSGRTIIASVQNFWITDRDVKTRATILGCLGSSRAIETHPLEFFNIIEEGLGDFTTDARGDVGSLVRIEAAKAVGAMWTVHDDPEMQAHIRLKFCGKVMRAAAEKLDRVRAESQRCVLLDSEKAAELALLPLSSRAYFRFLLEVQTDSWWSNSPHKDDWSIDLFEGYVTSADTGAEDLVRASRAALVDFCISGHTDLVCNTLFEVVKRNMENDRVLVSALEVMCFLFDMQIIQKSSLNWPTVYFQVQKASYRTGNLRKIEASAKLFSGMMEVYPPALDRLSGLILHRFPKVRNVVAEELWVTRGVGKGVNWAAAKKADMIKLRDELGIKQAS